MTGRSLLWAVLASAIALMVAPRAVLAQTDEKEPTTRPATKAEQAAEAFADGRKAFFRRDYKTAATLLTQAVKLDAEKLQYQYYLGRALQEDGKLDEAITRFAPAI